MIGQVTTFLANGPIEVGELVVVDQDGKVRRAQPNEDEFIIGRVVQDSGDQVAVDMSPSWMYSNIDKGAAWGEDELEIIV